MIILIVALALACLFLSPFWLIWVVNELFGIDWQSKYWAVLSLMIICGGIFNSSVKHNSNQ